MTRLMLPCGVCPSDDGSVESTRQGTNTVREPAHHRRRIPALIPGDEQEKRRRNRNEEEKQGDIVVRETAAELESAKTRRCSSARRCFGGTSPRPKWARLALTNGLR